MGKLLVAENSNQAKLLAKRAKAGLVRRVYAGLYTDNLSDDLAAIIQSHWMEIVAHAVPHGILSHRTAMTLQPVPYNKADMVVFVTSTYHKTLRLPGLIIKVIKGNCTNFLEQVLPNLSRSNIPRLLLENLVVTRRSDLKGVKTVGEGGVEEYLAKTMNTYGEARLNVIRDEAQLIAAELGYGSAHKKLNKIISALLVTHPRNDVLQTSYGKATANQQPYDKFRVQLFEGFVVYLRKCRLLSRQYHYDAKSYRNIAFFESYFSNFIEGTEFIIDEAEDIVFKNKEITHRHADSHDILANFMLANDYSEMTHTPKTADEFIELLKKRHAYLMKERPEKKPGVFKDIVNRAGNTTFVLPELVVGTLIQGFKLYQVVDAGLPKALFMHFLVSEIHPFLDGNGRLARIMMNAELVSETLHKIIIPTVHRDNYLNGLRFASRNQSYQLYCKVMDQAQGYVASIHWSDYGEAREKLENDFADQIPDEGLPIFNRALRNIALSEFDL